MTPRDISNLLAYLGVGCVVVAGFYYWYTPIRGGFSIFFDTWNYLIDALSGHLKKN